MHLIPSWAPNVHPMLVHFPIVLVMLAVLTDLVRVIRVRAVPAWMGTALYVLAALAAVVAVASGRSAAGTVRTPGMAHALVGDHRTWALATTGALVVAAALRVGAHLRGRMDGRIGRVLLVAVSLALALLVQQTAERGARLVYEQGVGVISGHATEGAATLPRD